MIFWLGGGGEEGEDNPLSWTSMILAVGKKEELFKYRVDPNEGKQSCLAMSHNFIGAP